MEKVEGGRGVLSSAAGMGTFPSAQEPLILVYVTPHGCMKAVRLILKAAELKALIFTQESNLC